MKYIVLALGLVLCVACNTTPQEKDSDPSEKDHPKHHNAHSEQKTANDYMHKSSVKDLIARFESPERDAYQKPDQVMAYLGDLNNKVIMDIGAGSGYFSVRLAEKGAKVIAADVNDEFQNALKTRIKKNGLKNIECRKIPYDSPELKDDEVDMVFIVNTYHHIENRSDYFTLVKRGIKEDGSLVIIDFLKADSPVGPPLNHKLAMDVVITELKAAGFSDFDINVELLPYQYIITAR